MIWTILMGMWLGGVFVLGSMCFWTRVETPEDVQGVFWLCDVIFVILWPIHLLVYFVAEESHR